MRAMVVALMILAAAAAFGAETEFWAQATYVRGSVSVAARSGEATVPLARGAVLEAGAEVVTTGDGRATFLLSDGGLLVVPSSARRVLEPAARRAGPSLGEVAHNLTRTLAAGGDEEPLLKHLGGLREEGRNLAVAPRRTRVRPGPVRLAWEPAPGVASYVVRVLGPAGSVLEEQVGGTVLEIGSGKLQAGAGYVWEVRDASSPDSLAALGSGSFAVLDGETARRVAAAESEIEGAGLNTAGGDSTATYLRYQVCRDAELYLEAAGLLGRLLAGEPGDRSLEEQQRVLWAAIGLDPDRAALAFEGVGAP